MDAEEIQHEFIYVDEAGFNLAKTRRRGRNVIGHRAITNVPGERGGNITLCAAITQNGVLHHHANLGPYNANLILAFLDRLHEIVTALNQVDQMRYIVVWDNVSFHRAALVQNWFHEHPEFEVLYLPPYSPFRNPIEVFFSMAVEGHGAAVIILKQLLCRGGFVTRGDSSNGALPMKT
ncbi:hypothetical protein N1851_028538 [Merluccius polli]|uniref:Tc1-like transposase DDE domain-containing protein n=1 Tax=Merluccius polli TaxID=89951 RepID=A0AA47NSG7_MERPO|nr:hypothetical protein N1851_028538 [Merluccius polli]